MSVERLVIVFFSTEHIAEIAIARCDFGVVLAEFGQPNCQRLIVVDQRLLVLLLTGIDDAKADVGR